MSNITTPKWRMTRIQVDGLNQIRLLNFIRSENIVVYDLTIIDNSSLCLTIHNQQIKKLYAILDRYNYQYTILVYDWLKVFLMNSLKRIGAICGVITFSIMLMLSNLFVWDIKISGLTYVPQNIVENILEQENIHNGILASKIDKTKVKKQILNLDSVVDVTINMEGTTLSIVVFEDLYSGSPYTQNSIYSHYDAIVKNIFVTEGTPVVQVGDKVGKGDELISQNIYNTNGEILTTVKANGRVYGIVTFDANDTVAHYETIYKKTGRQTTSTVLNFMGLTIGKNSPPNYPHYDTTQTTGLVFGKNFLPIQYTKTTYNELKAETIKNDTEALIKSKIKELEDFLIIKAGGNALTVKHDIREIIGGYRIDVFVETYLLLNKA